MKLQSISDVITNSSTEVFVLYDQSGLERIKEMVTDILQLTSDHCFDDLFTIDLSVDMESFEEWWFEEDGTRTKKDWEDFLKNTSKEEILEMAKEHDQDSDSYQQLITGYEVSPNPAFEDSEKIKNVCKSLRGLENLFDTEARYC